jgi:hypothetical protein
MIHTSLRDLYRADSKPGTAHRDNVQENKHQSVAKRWGKDRCDCCGRMFDTRSLRWLTRTKRISLECQLEREKEASRMRARNQTQGAT